MTTISERLHRMGDCVDSLVFQQCAYEGRDTIDALEDALIVARFAVGAMQTLITAHRINSPIDTVEVMTRINAALAKAKGKQE